MSSKSSTTASSSRVIDQWIHSTIHHNHSNITSTASQEQPSQHRPYLTLIQSSCSYQTRQTAVAGKGNSSTAIGVEDEEVYRRARVRTPSANAQRDMTGGLAWLFYLLDNVLLKMEECHVIWVSTTNSIALSSRSSHSNIQIVNVANNPIGWDNDNNDGDGEELSMINLESISTAIQQKAQQASKDQKVVVVFESLGPLMVLHGVSRLIEWFQSSAFHTKNIIKHMILPFLQHETWTSWQHRQLEDIAHALLFLRNGEMTLVRQGVRDKSNIVRHDIPFRFDYSTLQNNKNWIPIVLEQDEDTVPLEEEEQEENDNTSSTETVGVSESSLSPSSSSKTRPSSAGRTKVTLQHQNDTDARQQPSTTISTTTTAKQQSPPQSQSQQQRPQIYIQDDDPEYHDFDEDDPDDDLDI